MDADELTEPQGWAAVTFDRPAWATQPAIELPWLGVKRGGIQWPTNIVDTVGFMYRRPAWYRRWAVEMHHTRTWTLYGAHEGGTDVDVVVRTWSSREARRVTLMLTPLVGRL